MLIWWKPPRVHPNFLFSIFYSPLAKHPTSMLTWCPIRDPALTRPVKNTHLYAHLVEATAGSSEFSIFHFPFALGEAPHLYAHLAPDQRPGTHPTREKHPPLC